MRARHYGEPVALVANQTSYVVVDPGARLTVYVDAPCTLAWVRDLVDPAPQTWAAPTGPDRIWPVDVPEGVHQLKVTAGGGSAVLLRLTYAT